jgi:hypothetical protein
VAARPGVQQRDLSARTFEQVFSRAEPRDPESWVDPQPRPVPAWTLDADVVGEALSALGKGIAPALIAKAKELGVPLPPQAAGPDGEIPSADLLDVLRGIAHAFFPALPTKPVSAD